MTQSKGLGSSLGSVLARALMMGLESSNGLGGFCSHPRGFPHLQMTRLGVASKSSKVNKAFYDTCIYHATLYVIECTRDIFW